jgi:ribosomal protein S18 acetylase RimI-like enzyme
MAVRLSHLNLPARDPKAQARWYGERFGLEVDGAFAFGPGTLLAFEPGEPVAPRGSSHFGFEVASRAEVTRLAGVFGCDPEIDEAYAGFKAADPEGNRFEVYCEERSAPAPTIRALSADDGAWLAEASEPLGGLEVVSRGTLHALTALPGVVALRGGERVGFACYRVSGPEAELVAIRAVAEGAGVGTALLAAVEAAAAAAGCRELRVVTTNDNTPALRFYQQRGFRIAAIGEGAVDRARRLKPSIGAVGLDGIPRRDEIELGRPLRAGRP